MKRLLLLLVLSALTFSLLNAGNKSKYKMVSRYNQITNTWAAYPEVTIHDIQFVVPESLAAADGHQVSADVFSLNWKEQTSSLMGDTVVIVAQVVTPCGSQTCGFGGITFTAHGWTMMLRDTAYGATAWSGLLTRIGGSAGSDSTQAIIDHFNAAERGDIIRITGIVEEFPTDRMNTTTQLHPIPGIEVEILDSKPIPPPPIVPVSDFYSGPYPGGIVKYSTGERWEGVYIEMVDLSVVSILNSARGTFTMSDNSGNYISELDAGYNFALTSSETPPITPDTSVTHFHVPNPNAVIDTIKGIIQSNSGGENPRGFRMCPILLGDIKYGISLPTLNTHRRYPVAPSSGDSVAVQTRVIQTPGGNPIASAHLFVSVNGGAWDDRIMTLIDTSSTYQAYIVDIDGNPWPANTSIRYFVKGIDNLGNSNTLANSSTAVGRDTSQGFFFFTVLDRPLTIQDIQYTPYPNGRTGYLGAVVSVSGIVTADTSDILGTPLNVGGTSGWYMQNGNAPWSGIWIAKRDSATGALLSAMHKGDSVIITGTVQEDFEVTRIYDSLVTIVSPGHPVPAPVTIPSGTLGTAGNGNAAAEPYEGMLVRVVNGQISSINPTFADITEYEINDGSGGLLIRREGINSYSNLEGDTTSGKTKIFHVSDKVDTAVGEVYFSFNHYKLVPRQNSDFVAGEPYVYRAGWNMVSLGRDQIPAATGYAKAVLYPGSISNAFYYSGAYLTSPTIENRKGYWVKFPSQTTIRQLGKKRTLDTVQVVTGWNLIGGLGNAVPTNTIAISPGTNHFSAFYEYNGTYVIQDSLLPAKGLWVKASEAGYFVESASSMMIPKNSDFSARIKRNFNTVTVSDNAGHSQVLYFGEDTEGKLYLPDYELPPVGPEADAFDARFASGRGVEAYPSALKGGMEYAITYAAERGPVTVSWNIIGADGKRFTLRDGSAGKAKEIAGQGSITVGKSGSVTLGVLNGNAIPKEFALGQNYPNPFNPSTKFQVALPVASHLEIVIYNILGQKVATIADEQIAEGFHTMVWDGNNQMGAPASTGIYFMRMNATPASGTGSAFTAVKKLIMLK
jgi:hypothetical protein